MGKYLANKRKKNKKWLVVTILILALAFMAAVWIAAVLSEGDIPVLPDIPRPSGTHQDETEGSATVETVPAKLEPIALGQGLEIMRMGNYAGIYMEDGSDDIVSDVMMIILKNTSDADLQLARIDLEFEELTAEFEVTNLPAGESVVLLEKNRSSDPGQDCKSALLRNTVFFSEPMSLAENKFSIEAREGGIDLTNISGTDISGEIYIYYKNSASDLLYGGITYRARVEGGLAAGETARIMTTHFHPDTCRILNVDCGG